MIEFEYLAPNSLEECLLHLSKAAGKRVVLAGGTSLIPGIRENVIQPTTVIDLRHLAELTKIHRADSRIPVFTVEPRTTLPKR